MKTLREYIDQLDEITDEADIDKFQIKKSWFSKWNDNIVKRKKYQSFIDSQLETSFLLVAIHEFFKRAILLNLINKNNFDQSFQILIVNGHPYDHYGALFDHPNGGVYISPERAVRKKVDDLTKNLIKDFNSSSDKSAFLKNLWEDFKKTYWQLEDRIRNYKSSDQESQLEETTDEVERVVQLAKQMR